MNFFEQSEYTMYSEEFISGDDVHYCSEEEGKMTWMRETRIRIYMPIEFKACLDEVD